LIRPPSDPHYVFSPVGFTLADGAKQCTGGPDGRALQIKMVIVVCLIGGALLATIGVHFLLVPESAAYTFGIADQPRGYEFSYIIGVRDVWLGLLVMALAALREWRALALWFALGAVVCLVDASIAFTSSGRPYLVLFHMISGIVCISLAVLLDRVARRVKQLL
jgi:hypothetical protein